LEMLELWGVPASAYSCALLAESLVEKGAVQEARTVLGQSETPPDTADRPLLLDGAWPAVLLAEGQAEEALERSELWGRHAGWRSHPLYTHWRSSGALALARLGRSEEAVAAAEVELERARQWGAPGIVGRALRVLGTVER